MWCIDHPYTDPLFNLAVEDYLFNYGPESVFMLWRNTPAVIVGKHQDVRREVDIDYARRHAIPVIRRFSGGGAVYHDLGNLNLTLIGDYADPLLATFTGRLVGFLHACSLSARADMRQTIWVHDFKVSGCAQYIRKGRCLHHATLLYSTDLEVLSKVLDAPAKQNEGQPAGSPSVKSVKSPVANVSSFLPVSLSIDTFRKNLFHYFFKDSGSSYPYSFTADDLNIIQRLKNEKYTAPRWNINTYSL